MMADSSDDPRLGTVIAGYRIEERIGRGGMGVVYRAQHLNLQRRAAIKIIAPDLAESDGFRERFTREARIAAALQHPNIVTVYDAGEQAGVYYIAMEYVDGSTLKQIVTQRGAIAPGGVVNVLAQMCEALAYAHEKGIVHRDVKTANAMWTRERKAKIMDFGLARAMEERSRKMRDERRKPEKPTPVQEDW